jgi:uncharacterized SAM-binding protein YcdF (DUF218 family)
MRVRRAGLITLIVISAAFAAGLWFYEPVLVSLGKWLDPSEPLRSATSVMVLPGGPETRPFVATAMVRNGLAVQVLTSSAVNSPDAEDGIVPPDELLFREILQRRGIRDDQIRILPGAGNSTFADAQGLRAFLDQHPDETVAVVTDVYHVRRARWVFHKVLGEKAENVYFAAAPSDTFSADDWWRCEDGLKTYVGEYCKLVVYFALYGGMPVWIAAGVVLMLAGIVVRRGYRRGWGRSVRPAGQDKPCPAPSPSP